MGEGRAIAAVGGLGKRSGRLGKWKCGMLFWLDSCEKHKDKSNETACPNYLNLTLAAVKWFASPTIENTRYPVIFYE